MPKHNSLKPKDSQRQGYSQEDRNTFLSNCKWEDDVWTLSPTNAVEETKPCKLNWAFRVSKDELFTAAKHQELLEKSKKLLYLAQTRSILNGMPQKSKSVSQLFDYLRALLIWMLENNIQSFDFLDDQLILKFRSEISKRTTNNGRNIKQITVQKYLSIISYLLNFKTELNIKISSPQTAARFTSMEREFWPYTPNEIALPLIEKSKLLIKTAPPAALTGLKIYSDEMLKEQKLGTSRKQALSKASKKLFAANLYIQEPRAFRIKSAKDLSKLINSLYTACFVLISYLTGARVSEILTLKDNCLRRVSNGDGLELTVIAGRIFKQEAEYYGRPHEWVAPPLTQKAIEVLILLSEKHRLQTARNDLWLRSINIGSAEWEHTCRTPIEISTRDRLRGALLSYSDWLNLPKINGRKWRLSTHQGRKTFARFAALRDRSSLFALSQQLGHRERAITDFSYSGQDYDLSSEIDSIIVEQSISAWEHMLETPLLGGRAGAEIISKRPSFQGASMKQEITTYARILVDAGLTLGVCDWGYCIYRKEFSSCKGSNYGPSPLRREPSTCASCKNFALTKEHTPYWEYQVIRSLEILEQPDIPLQTARLARARIEEASKLIQKIKITDDMGHEDD